MAKSQKKTDELDLLVTARGERRHAAAYRRPTRRAGRARASTTRESACAMQQRTDCQTDVWVGMVNAKDARRRVRTLASARARCQSALEICARTSRGAYSLSLERRAFKRHRQPLNRLIRETLNRLRESITVVVMYLICTW